MSYIVFYNSSATPKLAIELNKTITRFYEIDRDLCDTINSICTKNNFNFLVKDKVKKTLPIINETMIKGVKTL